MVLCVLLCSSLVVSVDAASMWSRTYGGAEDNMANSLVATSDGGYAIACSSLLLKTDALGNMQWNKTYGGASLVEALDGGYAIGGWTESFGAGWTDFWLVKTDSNGFMQWNKTYGGTLYDGAFSLVATSDGGYVLAGYTESFGAGGRDFWLVKTDEFGVVPEYSSWLVPSLVLTATAFIIINKKRLFNKR
jgi:hypothetical protein